MKLLTMKVKYRYVNVVDNIYNYGSKEEIGFYLIHDFLFYYIRRLAGLIKRFQSRL